MVFEMEKIPLVSRDLKMGQAMVAPDPVIQMHDEVPRLQFSQRLHDLIERQRDLFLSATASMFAKEIGLGETNQTVDR